MIGMKEKYLFCLSVLLVLVLVFFPLAAVQGAGEDEETDNPFGDAEALGGSRLEDDLEEYLEEKGWELGTSRSNPGEGYLGWGETSIKASTGDASYGQSRVMAFEDAFMEAKGEFVLSRRREIATEQTSEFLRDDLPEIDGEEEDWGESMRERLTVLLEKAADLGEAKLDEMLREYDIDPGQYDSAGRTEKQNILYDAISAEATTEAFASLSGLVIERTFENNNSVGVLVKYNRDTEEIARQVASEEPVSLNPSYDPGLYIDEHLEQLEPEAIIDVHGVRIMQDEDGENVLVSFGQWSPPITETTSERRKELEFESAQKTARSRAEAALANFINSSGVMENISEVMEAEELYEEVEDNRTSDVREYDIGEYTEETVEQHGEVSLEGVNTYDTWEVNHPITDHIIVGRILIWSPETRDKARGDHQEDSSAGEEEEEEDDDPGEVRTSPF